MSFEENKHDLTPDDLNTNQWEVLPEEVPSVLENEDSLTREDLIIATDTKSPSKNLIEPTSPSEVLGEFGAEAEQAVETENVNYYEENFKAIKKQRGESFAKYLRGNMSEFMDQPNFKDEICRIIPNRRQALRALEDNYYYIREIFQDLYVDETEENEKTPLNPYELVKRVGYELYGPFKDAKEVEGYRDDFRSGEQLCTFNEVEDRLSAYNILWLRHKNYDQILPADELTQENLSEEWKQYLRKRDLYNKETGLYNIDNIEPAREDPYGTSSMSVQISKIGSHVSIKNHYNHRVRNPDSTLGNNLNNVIPGLKRSIYHKIGREDLLVTPSVELDDRYVVDNDNGIHFCRTEVDNIYYGDYEFVENGEVKTILEDKYLQIKSDMYIRRGDVASRIQKAKDEGKDYEPYIKLVRDDVEVRFSNNDDSTRRITYYNTEGGKLADYNYSVDKGGDISHSTLYAYGEIMANEWIDIDEMVCAYDNNILIGNSVVKSLTLEGSDDDSLYANYRKRSAVYDNDGLESLYVGVGRHVDSVSWNRNLKFMQVGTASRIASFKFDTDLAESSIYLAEFSELSIDGDLPKYGLHTITVPEHSTVRFGGTIAGSSYYVLGDEIDRIRYGGAHIEISNFFGDPNVFSDSSEIGVIVENDDGSERYFRLVGDDSLGVRAIEDEGYQDLEVGGGSMAIRRLINLWQKRRK